MKRGSAALAWLFTLALIGLSLLAFLAPAAHAHQATPSTSAPTLYTGRTGLLFPARAVAQDTGEPVARFYLFYSATCPHCHEIMENYLPTVYEKYGDQVEYKYFDINEDSETYLTMLALEQVLGLPEDRQGYVPALIIGDKVMVGGNEIPEQLEPAIDEYLAQGGVDFVPLDALPEVVLPTPAPTVQILVIFDATHPDFEALNTLISSLGQEYENGLQAYALDTSQEESAELLAQINAGLGIDPPAAGTPQVLIGRTMLVGLEEIQSQLPDLVAKYYEEGGLTLPSLEELSGVSPTATVTPPEGSTPAPTAESTAQPVPSPTTTDRPIYLAFFEQAGCQDCARTTYDLRVVQEQYPQLQVERFPIEEAENKRLNEWLSEKVGVPEEQRLSTPMVIVGEDYLIGTDATLNNLLAVVSKYQETGAERTWEDYDPNEAGQNIIDRFQSFGMATVLVAGLIDGLNPCAFATLVFFISYLTFTGRRGRDILFVGLSFTLGVFITYLLVGMGLLTVVQSLGIFSSLGKWLYLLTALLCIVLAILTFRDYGKARQGQVTEMALKLPMSFRRRINKVIRESSQVRAFVAMAFVTGFVVSLIELACTGQVYLPTIVYVLSQTDLAAQAFLYLVLYCLMFILPLIVVFLLSYFGATSQQLGQFVNRHTATIKLVTGLVFVGLALWMTWTVAPLFGIQPPWTWVLMGVVVGIIALGAVLLKKYWKESPTSKTRQRRSRA
jgi:cytochrome c biogenesis protein CcdA/glutaredoxin